MEPYSYSKFRMTQKNTIRDLISVAGPLNVKFLCQFTSPGEGTNLNIMRLPQGPSFLFKLENYNDQFQTKPDISVPLTILTGFNENNTEQKLTAELFKNLFPSKTMQEVRQQYKENNQQIRIILVHYDQQTQLISIRHYQHQPVTEDDLLMQQLTEGIQLDQEQLKELGPRIDMKLFRILQNINSGAQLYSLTDKKYKEKLMDKQLEQQAKRSKNLQRRREIGALKAKHQRLMDKQAKQKKLQGLKQEQEEKRNVIAENKVDEYEFQNGNEQFK